MKKDLDWSIACTNEKAFLKGDLDLNYSDICFSEGERLDYLLNKTQKEMTYAYPLYKENSYYYVSADDLLEFEGERFLLLCYLSIFRRMPTMDELSSQKEEMQKGADKRDIIDSFANSREAKLRHIVVTFNECHISWLLKFYDARFIEYCYLYILHRCPDIEGMNNYLYKLRSGEITRVDVICFLVRSNEAKNMDVNCKIKGLYIFEAISRIRNCFIKFPVLGSFLIALENLFTRNKRIISIFED